MMAVFSYQWPPHASNKENTLKLIITIFDYSTVHIHNVDVKKKQVITKSQRNILFTNLNNGLSFYEVIKHLISSKTLLPLILEIFIKDNILYQISPSFILVFFPVQIND